MKSILFLIETIYSNIFRWNYLWNKKLFLDSFFHFRNSESVLNILKEKMIFIADVFKNVRAPKNNVRWMSKKSPFRGSFDK